MPLWLEKLLSNHTLTAVAASVLLVALVVLVVQDWRAYKRDEPIKIWHLREPIYRGDLLYPWAFVQRFGVYIGCLGAIVVAAVTLIATFLLS